MNLLKLKKRCKLQYLQDELFAPFLQDHGGDFAALQGGMVHTGLGHPEILFHDRLVPAKSKHDIQT